MADQRHPHHHHQHRPHRLAVPLRSTTPTAIATTSRPYPLHPYPASTPTPTPSKHRLALSSSHPHRPSSSNKTSLSFLLLLLLSLRSLYSLLPFLRSSPSFSLFPFSFLVSLLSFLLTSSFSIFTPSNSSDPFLQQKQHQPIFSLTLISQSQHKILVAKSLLLAVVFLLRFQALRYCGTAAMILAELTGNVAARFVADVRNRSSGSQKRDPRNKVRGFIALTVGLFLLSVSWDRIECFPLSALNVNKLGFFPWFPRENCIRVLALLLPFLSGFLGCYERVSMNWGAIRQLGRKRVRMISLFFTTIILFFPAVISVLLFESEGGGTSFGNLGWPLANTVIFGVLLSENFSDEKLISSKDFQKEYLLTFLCTLILELFYFPDLSLWGLLLCGLLLWIAVRELDPVYSNHLELGLESSESISTTIMKPIRHVWSERKSRKIALFLLINTGYMIVEFVAGFMSNSLGLISDACHMLFDCAALGIGLYASYISRLPSNSKFNYGRGRFEVLSGYVNAVFLVLVGALIVLESLERILDPQEISTNSLLTVSIGGLLVNVVGLIFFHEEHHHAHGGSCSHSHGHVGYHDHRDHKHQEDCNSVIHDCHGKSCQDDLHNHHHPNHHDHTDGCRDRHRIVSTECQDHHDHNDHHHHHHHHHIESCMVNQKSGSIRCDDHHQDHHVHVHQHVHNDHQDHVHHQHDQNDHHHHHIHQHNHTDQDDNVHQHDQDGHHHHHNRDNHHAISQPKKLPEKPKKHHHHIDHNMEGIFLHVLADTMGSVGVVISTLLIKYKGWLVADPACSIFISILIVASVIPLLRNSAEILLQRVPRPHEHDIREALDDVTKIKGVKGIQNLHVWSFTNTDVVGTINLHVSTETDKDYIKGKVLHILHDAGVKDLTLQVECVK